MKSWLHFPFFSKRRNVNNILPEIQWNYFKTRGILFILCAMMLSSPCKPSSFAKGKDPSQRKIEKEKERKDKEAQKKYEQAIKQHEKNQSAATRSMMKETRKESPKNTPIKPSSGKKCKQH
jgi:hypothetical protein